jgi:hypothetical protein
MTSWGSAKPSNEHSIVGSLENPAFFIDRLR